MAYVISIYCRGCNTSKQVTVGSGNPLPDLCHKCAKEKADEAEREHFHGLDGLTIEERIRRVEKWIYNHKHSKPISAMRL